MRSSRFIVAVAAPFAARSSGPTAGNPNLFPHPQATDVQVVEHFGHPIAVVPASDLNLKLTTAEDLTLAEAILANGLSPK